MARRGHSYRPAYTTPVLSWDVGVNRYSLKMGYHAEFLEALKADGVLRFAPQYDPEQKLWFLERYDVEQSDDMNMVKTLLNHYFPDGFTFIERPQDSHDFTITQSVDDSAYRRFFAALSKEQAKKLYFFMAKLFHTDTGGDNDAMVEVNTSWDTIKQERGW